MEHHLKVKRFYEKNLKKCFLAGNREKRKCPAKFIAGHGQKRPISFERFFVNGEDSLPRGRVHPSNQSDRSTNALSTDAYQKRLLPGAFGVTENDEAFQQASDHDSRDWRVKWQLLQVEEEKQQKG